MVRRNIELEARLIDDLLDITRISRGKMRLYLEVVDAHAVFHQALEICRGEIYTAGIRIGLELGAIDHHVKADPARLQQVFWNLVKNAIKFTAEGGTVTVRSFNVATAGRNGAENRLVVEIADTGFGIEPEMLSRIFNVFEQGEPTITRRFGGLGLGLPISLSVIEAHGGRLTASSPGKNLGSTFRVELAAVPVPAPSEPAEGPSDGAPAPPLKILLVEDHEDTARTMARLLRHLNHSVKTANSLVAALALASNEDFDLLISDIGLPDGNGLDLMRQLRTRCAVKGIALSGYGMDEDVHKSREAGFAAHLTKPIDFRKLEAILRKVTTGVERANV
jgi:CheY-like chemotaxis protein